VTVNYMSEVNIDADLVASACPHSPTSASGGQTILLQRERIKRKTIELRPLQHRNTAA
jgi:hypothetical protein